MAAGLERLYRRVRYGKPIVVVSGRPRFGHLDGRRCSRDGGLAIVTDGLRVRRGQPQGLLRRRSASRACTRRRTGLAARRAREGRQDISFLLKSLPPSTTTRSCSCTAPPARRSCLAEQDALPPRQAQRPARRGGRAASGAQVKEATFFLKRPQFEVLSSTHRHAGRRARQAEHEEFLGQPLDVEKMAAVGTRSCIGTGPDYFT